MPKRFAVRMNVCIPIACVLVVSVSLLIAWLANDSETVPRRVPSYEREDGTDYGKAQPELVGAPPLGYRGCRLAVGTSVDELELDSMDQYVYSQIPWGAWDGGYAAILFEAMAGSARFSHGDGTAIGSYILWLWKPRWENRPIGAEGVIGDDTRYLVGDHAVATIKNGIVTAHRHWKQVSLEWRGSSVTGAVDLVVHDWIWHRWDSPLYYDDPVPQVMFRLSLAEGIKHLTERDAELVWLVHYPAREPPDELTLEFVWQKISSAVLQPTAENELVVEAVILSLYAGRPDWGADLLRDHYVKNTSEISALMQGVLHHARSSVIGQERPELLLSTVR